MKSTINCILPKYIFIKLFTIITCVKKRISVPEFHNFYGTLESFFVDVKIVKFMLQKNVIFLKGTVKEK